MYNPNPYFSWQLVRLTLKIMIQNDRYFMEVIHLKELVLNSFFFFLNCFSLLMLLVEVFNNP